MCTTVFFFVSSHWRAKQAGIGFLVSIEWWNLPCRADPSSSLAGWRELGSGGSCVVACSPWLSRASVSSDRRGTSAYLDGGQTWVARRVSAQGWTRGRRGPICPHRIPRVPGPGGLPRTIKPCGPLHAGVGSGPWYRLVLSPRRRSTEGLAVDEWWIRDLADELGVGYNRIQEMGQEGLRPCSTSRQPEASGDLV